MEFRRVLFRSTEDVMAYVVKLQSGIQSLKLYVGEDVEVLTLKTGESAPDHLPLTVLQSKLYADEELSVWAEVGEDFSWRKLDEFRDTLAKSPSLIPKMFPAHRSIIGGPPTRKHKDYSK